MNYTSVYRFGYQFNMMSMGSVRQTKNANPVPENITVLLPHGPNECNRCRMWLVVRLSLEEGK